MLTSVKTTGCTLFIEMITHAQVYPDQTVVYPVDYHQVQLVGDDARRMNEAMKAAGFVGEGTLVNPARISAYEDAGTTIKIFMEGADRVVHMPKEIEKDLFPAPESSAAVAVEKPRRSRKEAV